MIKMVMIGFLGKDAEVKIHGTESVINFSVAHTDKYKQDGTAVEKTTWVSCSWWVENHNIAQYLKKGTQVYMEGRPEAKSWTNASGEKVTGLNLRVFSLNLLSSGVKKDGGQNQQPAPATANTTQNTNSSQNSYAPYTGTDAEPVDDLPF